MNVDKLIKEIKATSHIGYYRPLSHVVAMRLNEDEFSPVRYVVSDSDDGDYGCFVVKCESFPGFCFDWYLGMWLSGDKDMQELLKDDRVLAALSDKFGDIAICLGPSGHEDLAIWKKIISRCLRNDDSLVDEIDVMFEHENAHCSNPARFAAIDDEWWLAASFPNDK